MKQSGSVSRNTVGDGFFDRLCRKYDLFLARIGWSGRFGFGQMTLPRRRLRMRRKVKPNESLAVRLAIRTHRDQRLFGAVALNRVFYDRVGNRIIDPSPRLPELTQLTAIPLAEASTKKQHAQDWHPIHVPQGAHSMELVVQRRSGKSTDDIVAARRWRLIGRDHPLVGIDSYAVGLESAQRASDFKAGTQHLDAMQSLWHDPALQKARAAMEAAQALQKLHYLLDLKGFKACERSLINISGKPTRLETSFLPVSGQDASLVDLEHAAVILALLVCENGVPVIEVPAGEEYLLRLVIAASAAHQLGARVRLLDSPLGPMSLGRWLHYTSLAEFLKKASARDLVDY